MNSLYRKILSRFGVDISPLNIMSKPEFGHSLWMSGGQVVVSLVTFISMFVLANWVDEEIVGSYRFIIALYATASVFALLGMGTALKRAVASGKSGSVYLAKSKKLLYGFIGSVFFVGVALYFYLFTEQTYLWLPLVLAAVTLPWSETYALYGQYLNGASRFKVTAVSLATERIFTSVFIILASIYFPSVLGLVLAYTGSTLIIRYYLFVRAQKIVVPNDEYDKGMVSYAKHLTGMSLIGAITAQLDKYILFFFFGPATLAAFWAASIIPQEAGRFLGIAFSTFFPRLVQNSYKDTVRFVAKVFVIALIGTLLLALLYALVSKYIFSILLSPYKDMYLMSSVLMLAYFVTPHLLVWSIFTAKRQVKELYYYSIFEPFLTAVLYFIFVPIFGVWGLVYALCLRTVIINLVAVFVLLKYRNYE